MNHLERQLAYFASIDHAERFRWQTEDSFVKAHEHETLRPFAEAIRKLRATQGRPLRIFESGCGEGVNMVHLRQLGITEEIATFTGIDPSAVAIEEAKRHGLDVQVGNGLALPIKDAAFDIAFCRDVFHHLEHADARRIFFSELMRIVRPGGFVAAVEPNPWNPMILALSLTVSEERGLRSISEPRMKHLFPGAGVVRVAPSAMWRFFLHFHSPLRKRHVLAHLVRSTLSVWESLCRAIAPTVFWSYRVYTWKKE